MSSPTLADLPPPPPGGTGWPWTEQSRSLPQTMADGQSWPRISIVTPSYNQGPFIEETIRSVLLQGYPNLEYVIIDGGSTDNTVEVVRTYEPWVASWVSEPDRGQAHAINKGWLRSTGEVLAWINSDDLYLPGAIQAVAEVFRNRPEVGIVHGDCVIWNQPRDERIVVSGRPFTLENVVSSESPFWQPTVFYRRELLEQLEWLDESFHYVLDRNLWLRAHGKCTAVSLQGRSLAVYRDRPGTKTHEEHDRFPAEFVAMLSRYCPAPREAARFERLRRKEIGNYYYAAGYYAVTVRSDYLQGFGWLLRAVLAEPSLLARVPRATMKLLRSATGPE